MNIVSGKRPINRQNKIKHRELTESKHLKEQKKVSNTKERRFKINELLYIYSKQI